MFPASLAIKQVTGSFPTYPDGAPASGSVRFASNVWLIGPSDDKIIRPFEVVAGLDENGAFSVDLPATDDPQWNPQGWSYTVTISVGGRPLTRSMSLLYSGPGTVDLADILQAVPATAGESYLTLAAAALKADLASPALTGVPTAPTAAYGNGTTQLATTAYADAAALAVAFTANAAYDAAQAAILAAKGASVATDHGLVGWSFDPAGVQAATILPTAGVTHVVRVRAMSATVTNILMHFTVAGSGLTAGQCYATLHNDAGAILGAGAITADQAAAWASSGLKTMALTTPQGVTAGAFYRVRFWFNGTTGPTVSRGVNSNTAITNVGLVAPNFRFATADTGVTTPGSAPGNIGTMTGAATAWWVGLS